MKKKNLYYGMVIGLLLIALVVVVIQNRMLVQNPEVETTEPHQKNSGLEGNKTILDRVMQFPEMKPYLNYQKKNTLLTEKEITELSEKQPVIYKDLPSPVYKIELQSGDSSLLVIYDPQQDKILRTFEIRNMRLSGVS